jgi:hypothetical protein
MDIFTSEQFEMLLPLAAVWAEEQERMILLSGVPLTESQVEDARQIGVLHPDRVRLLRVPQIPVPTHPALATAAQVTGLISPAGWGVAFRYGIFIRNDCWTCRELVAHELVHVVQYERLGGFEEFLRPYLTECLTPPGYPHGPMEQEAITKAAELCKPPLIIQNEYKSNTPSTSC